MKSLPIIVDTTNAIEMKPESDQATNYIPQSSSGRTGLINDQTIKSRSNIDEQKSREVAVNFTFPNQWWQTKLPYMKQSVLGVTAALTAFLFVLTLFSALRKRSCDHKNGTHLCEVKINIDR